LYIFNYHRVGNPEDTDFDPNTFSCTQDDFASQVNLLKKRFRLVNFTDLIMMIEDNVEVREPLGLITFDDGYSDNFTKAMPVLESLDANAAFFIPTAFIGGRSIPWWDEAAWIIRQTKKKEIKLSSWEQAMPLSKSNIKHTIREVLRQFKLQTNLTMADKLDQLVEACECELNEELKASLFMTWENVSEMHRKGMDIGSHTCTHQILSHLSLDDQRVEIVDSKTEIENHIDDSVKGFAYPVGGLDAFTQQTLDIVRGAGYKLAFTFPVGGGFNPFPAKNQYELSRLPVESEFAHTDIKYACAFASPY